MVSTRATVFCALQTMQQLAHHFLVTLFHVENVANSCAESNAFNPFVVGSTPAGPTNLIPNTLCESEGCFFMD